MGFDCWRLVRPLDAQSICHHERYIMSVSIYQIRQKLIVRELRSSFEIFINGISYSRHNYVEEGSVNGVCYWRILKVVRRNFCLFSVVLLITGFFLGYLG